MSTSRSDVGSADLTKNAAITNDHSQSEIAPKWFGSAGNQCPFLSSEQRKPDVEEIKERVERPGQKPGPFVIVLL